MSGGLTVQLIVFTALTLSHSLAAPFWDDFFVPLFHSPAFFTLNYTLSVSPIFLEVRQSDRLRTLHLLDRPGTDS